jgi:hypothetical protein
MWFETSSLILVRQRKNCNGKLTLEMDIVASSFLGIAPANQPSQPPAGGLPPGPESQPSYQWETYRQPGSLPPRVRGPPESLQFQPLTFEQPISPTAAAPGPNVCPSCGGAITSNVSKFCTFCGKPLN